MMHFTQQRVKCTTSSSGMAKHVIVASLCLLTLFVGAFAGGYEDYATKPSEDLLQRKLVGTYLGVYENPIQEEVFPEDVDIIGDSLVPFDDGPHFLGIKQIIFEEGKYGITSIQFYYREDGEGGYHGIDGGKSLQVFDLQEDEDITSITIKYDSKKKILTWIEFVTSANRAIAHESYKSGSKDSKDSKYVVETTFIAPEGYILGGIHGYVKGKKYEDRDHSSDGTLIAKGVYWVKKSPIARTQGANILLGPGSLFLDDPSITQHISEITDISEAMDWIENGQTEFEMRNPVIIWQIFAPGGLFVHRERFLEQAWPNYIAFPRATAGEFVRATVELQAANMVFDAQPSVADTDADIENAVNGAFHDDPEQIPMQLEATYHLAAAGCSAELEISLCSDGDDCCSELCLSGTCVHCISVGNACEADKDCCEWTWCTDGICIEAPSSSPSGMPSTSPSDFPSSNPSVLPSHQPSAMPSAAPSVLPSESPSSMPSVQPSSSPSDRPSSIPSIQPSALPTSMPSSVPTISPRYDSHPCKKDSQCVSGMCIGNVCGEMLNTYLGGMASPHPLPHSVPYGINQHRGEGGAVVFDGGKQVRLEGNAWRAFPFQYRVTRNTVLKFKFELTSMAEGHAICLDEDTNEDVELEHSRRCFHLAGTQAESWKEVWKLAPTLDGTYSEYTLNIGALREEGDRPYINPGTEINYLAIIQDNDASPEEGESIFSSIEIYEATTGTNQYTEIICERRSQLLSKYSNPETPGNNMDTETILRYSGEGVGAKKCPYYSVDGYTRTISVELKGTAEIFPSSIPQSSWTSFGVSRRFVDMTLFSDDIDLYYLPMRYCDFDDEDASFYVFPPTAAPSAFPSTSPSLAPSVAPSDEPTLTPSVAPSDEPTLTPSVAPSDEPTLTPSISPSAVPSAGPSDPERRGRLLTEETVKVVPQSTTTSRSLLNTGDTDFMFEMTSTNPIRYKKGGDLGGVEYCLGDAVISAAEANTLGLENLDHVPIFPCNGSNDNPVAGVFESVDNMVAQIVGETEVVTVKIPITVCTTKFLGICLSYRTDYNDYNIEIKKKFSEIKCQVNGIALTSCKALDSWRDVRLSDVSSQDWVPNYCQCDQEPNPLTGFCRKVDACFYDRRFCPSNSECEPVQSRFCECATGFLNSVDSSRQVDSSSGEQCVPALYADQKVTGESFRMTVNTETYPSLSSFVLDVTRADSSQKNQPLERVFPHDGNVVLSTGSVFEYNFNNLESGRKYSVTAWPMNADGFNISTGEASISTTAVTHCCCECNEANVFDVTGRPVNVTGHQENGHVTFSFVDNSRCAEGYAFTRLQLSQEFDDIADDDRKVVFAPNYYYYPKKKCSRATVSPGLAASDDLRESGLRVGTGHRYCIRAIASFYSDHPFDESETLFSSDESCFVHYVRWQASISGVISTDPEAGSLPIEGVSVSWEIMGAQDNIIASSDDSEPAVTGSSGRFDIDFDFLNTYLDTDSYFPVRLKFSKNTLAGNSTIKHTFLCNEGAIDCTESGNVVYVKHLDFDKPVHVYDDTSVPLTGRILIEGTDSEESGDGCPILGAQVCLMHKNPRTDDTPGACVFTDFEGGYELPAIIGTTVGIEVNYNTHTFLPAVGNPWDYETGVYVDINGRYERNDWVDTTRAHLHIEVAGGFCNHTLGISTIQVEVAGGCKWKRVLTQEFFTAIHVVPAHLLDIKVLDVINPENLQRVLDPESSFEDKSINLIDAADAEADVEETESVNSDVDGAEESLVETRELLRFQYDGRLEIDFRLDGADLKEECETDMTDTADTSYSLHVLKTQEKFKFKLFLKYFLLDGADDGDSPLYCDIVDDAMVVRVYNDVGVDIHGYEGWAESITDPIVKNMLELCSSTEYQQEDSLDPTKGEKDFGCEFKVEHEIINGKKANAVMIPRTVPGNDILYFLTGRPEYIPPYKKELRLEVKGTTMQHKAEFIIEGDFDLGPGASFSLPTYKPLMVIRDPPGGLSYASYQNVQTTVKIKSDKYESVQGFDAGLSLGFLGGTEIGPCAGGGLGAIFLGCVATLKTELAIDATGETTQDSTNKHTESTHTAKYTTTWSYQTSENPLEAGRSSDVMVVPNLNVEYHQVRNVDYIVETCTATATDEIKFDLKNVNNKAAFSFLNIRNIEDYQIPELEKSIALRTATYQEDYLANDLTNSTYVDETQALRDALEGWTDALHDYDTINDKAMTEGLKTAPMDWFTEWVQKNDMEADEPTINEHWASLVPEDLADNAVALQFPYVEQAGLGDGNDLKTTQRLHFSGGGNTMVYTLDHEAMDEELRLAGDGKNQHDVYKIGAKTENDIKSFGGVGVNINGDFHVETTSTMTETDSKESKTSISFTLGDPDREDEFVTDVYIDETHGTFVFPLISGRSKNPHEPNTEWGERPFIDMVSYPLRPILPDEEIVIQLKIANFGKSNSSFNVYLDHVTNKEGLTHDLSGDSLRTPINYWLDSDVNFEQDLTIKRGPEAFLYEKSKIWMVGEWDGYGVEGVYTEVYNYIDDDGKKWIKFEEPCPTVEWAGDLKRDRGFLANVNDGTILLSVYNPSHAVGSFQDLANRTRLETVNVLYRQLGDVEWERAFVVDGTDRLYIDFANPAKTLWEENSFGYANIEWDIGNTLTADGNYELMVETVCTADPNLKSAPDNFNGYAAIPITGVMDRKIPKRYGSPLPLGDIVIPGEEIAVMFSEPILCEQPYRFDINVTVSGIPGYFDERNLNIFCSGRKLAFQFDQTNIGYDELMGRDMNVTINKVSDRHLNKMNELDPIDFSKTLANLNLDEVTTSFQFTVDDDCDGSVDGEALQNQIAGILALPQPSRIDIQSAVCNNDGTTVATVMIGPALSAGTLRRKLSKADEDAITLVHKLMGKTDTRNGNDGKVGSQRRVLANGKEFHVGPMRITPGSGDKKLLDTHPDLQLEEEMIRSGGETLLLQKKRIHLMENKLEGDIDEVLEALKLERQELHLVEMVLACGFVGGNLLLLAATCFFMRR